MAPLFAYLYLNCLFYVLHPLLFFVLFNFYYPFYFLLLFSCFLSILCFVICTVSPYVYYYSSLFLCKSVKTLPQGGNSIAVIKYRTISYIISYPIVCFGTYVPSSSGTTYQCFKSQMLCEASQGIWHILLPEDGI